MIPRKRFDRLWWALLALTVVGVAAVIRLTREAERRRTEWIGPVPGRGAEAAPAADTTGASAAAPGGPGVPAEPLREGAPGGTRVVQLLTTPERVTVGAMTPACRATIRARGPWRDSVQAKPWPECVDASGNPMVVQFCTYARLSTGEWIHTENTKDAPRCQAELPRLRAGKLKGVATR
jgi:hypothetical protein